MSSTRELDDSNDIAIVGMALRFPGAATPRQFWENLRAGVESISRFSDQELRAEGVGDELLGDEQVVKAGALLAGVELFDAPFFGFNRREAEITDPQHRLLLECCWEALESAGCDPDSFTGPIGLFAGASISTYLLHNLFANWGLLDTVGRARLVMGNCNNFLTTWASYKLNLRGPSVAVQTACSTSLVAVHMAWQSLLNGECDVALAGGSSISLPQRGCYRYREGGIHSPDGHCRAFDAAAAGTVSGNGVGVVALRRLADALADGNTVHALVKGSAVNNDGSGKIGYTAPSVTGQSAVIAEALAVSGVDPDTIGYVEAHGTGTPLGDPIEIGALTRAFRAGTPRKGYCGIGSVKTNVGHLDTAAGVAGLIKTVLAMEHGELPPSLHFATPNPRCELPESPFYVVDRLRPWPRGTAPRRAAVSSLGIGGTNANVVLEEAPAAPATDAPRECELLVLSARSHEALAASAARLGEHLRQQPELNLADVAFTLGAGRKAFDHRLALVCRGTEDAAGTLADASGRRLRRAVQESRRRSVAFLFPGQGVQHAGMARELYAAAPRFRAVVDECCALLAPLLGRDLKPLLLAAEGAGSAADSQLADTALAQPALFVCELAWAELWMRWGIHPQAVFGHSLGEYVAACVAGVFSREEALALVVKRGRLLAATAPGAMLAVALGQEELAPLLAPELSLAAVESPSRCVVAGAEAAVAELAGRLVADGVPHRRLATRHGFHSQLVEPVLDDFAGAVSRLTLRPPTIAYLSGVTGTWASAAEVTDPGYWVRQLRGTVCCGSALGELLGDAEAVALELGPGRTLTALARQNAAAGAIVVAALGRAGEPQLARSFEALGRLWLSGLQVDWAAVHEGARRRRLPLPGYPFVRQRYWIEPPPALVAAAAARGRGGAPVADVGEPVQASAAPGGLVAAAPGSGAVPDGRAGAAARLERIRDVLYEIVDGLAGIDRQRLDGSASFLELGVDSLLLIQFSQSVQRRLGVKLSLTRLLEETTSLDTVAAFLDQTLPAGDFAGAATPPAAAARPGLPGPAAVAADADAAAAAQKAAAVVMLDELSAAQQRSLDRLIERYGRRTWESKRRADGQRLVLADNRASAGFRQRWKELIYPLVAERSAGARFWDLDGNEYVDLAMGFGVHLFGHSPDFITEAIARQLARGLHLGPQSDLAGEVAESICRLTGTERAAFCNSGTEAVMGALRIARAVTGRRQVALFTGAYHGSFDGVLVRALSASGTMKPMPVAPGVPASLVGDALPLRWCAPEALDALRRAGGEVAAILVEPVQSRRPDLQPREFLRELRTVADEIGAALIFDEVVTGFRCHPGGAQALFGVHADLVTYGKVIGGGMPIGVIAGKAAYMDAIDGGRWRFGDTSSPKVDKTFFTGTFCKHPLAMAAARAVACRLEAAGPRLQQELNDRCTALAARLNAWFAAEQMPVRVVHFSSLFLFEVAPQAACGDLFFFHVVDQGVYVWEGRTCFLSTAHGDAEIETIVAAAQTAAQAMRQGGFFASRGPRPREAPLPPGLQPAAILPLTPGQEQLWVMAQLGEDAARAYNEGVTLRLGGKLRAGALACALQALSDRHDSLRATFAADGQTQRIAPRQRLPLPTIDLSALPEDRRSDELRAGRRAETRRLFDLAIGPLLRCRLWKLEPELHALLLAYHHIVCDGRSLGVLLAELRALYVAAAGGAPCRLGTPERLTDRQPAAGPAGDGTAGSLRWWREQLAPPLPALELPGDRPRPPLFTYRGGRQTLLAGSGLYERVKSLAAGEGATLFVVLLAGFCALLHRLSGQDDLIAGIPSVGAWEGSRPFVGYDLNLLAIRSRVAAGWRFGELLASLKRRVAAAYDHREAPFPEVVRGLGLAADFSRPPLAAVLFNVDRAEPRAEASGLTMVTEVEHAGAARFELFVNAVDLGDSLAIDCEHYLDLYGASTVRRWLRHYRTLLAAVAEDPRRAIADLPLMGAAERHQLLVEWNDTAGGLPAVCLHRLLEATARQVPDAVAVAAGERRLSHAALHARANQLARYLRRHGVRSEVPVGVCLERSAELVVALLAVLKAGGAYVPLDPVYPPARLAAMLADLPAAGGGPLVLTTRALRDRLPASARPLALDAEPWPNEPQPDLLEAPPPEALAYVIYTSGSTGRPKGVQVTHRALVNFLCAMRERPGFAAGERLLAVTSLSFDIAGLEIYLPLLCGGAVTLAASDETADGARLLARLLRGDADVLQATPATWQLLLAAGEWPSGGLRALCGGEALSPELAARLAERSAGAWNLYGPTETTIWSSTGRLAADRDGAGWALLGRPILNTEIVLLDSGRQPAPIGVAAQLCIAGEGLARGYRGQPELTAERFLPHPAGRQPGARLYATGDLARLRPAGEIEFLGRADQQVKVRGFRIELGDVEAAIACHPEVREVVVVARAAVDGALLAAFLVPRHPQEEAPPPGVEALRVFVAERLPAYMIPASFVILPELPRLPNGKIDRRRLPDPARERPDLERAFIAPRSALERQIAEVWQIVLGLDRVGVEDGFFALGGHSLSLLRVRNRLQELGHDVSPTELFRFPTIGALAAHLGRRGADAAPALGEEAIAGMREGRGRLVQRQGQRQP
jgi:amino acid adenylation domain-containing protein